MHYYLLLISFKNKSNKNNKINKSEKETKEALFKLLNDKNMRLFNFEKQIYQVKRSKTMPSKDISDILSFSNILR